MTVYAIGATSLIGGGTGALDAEYADSILNGDPALTFVSGGKVYFHIADSTSGAAENSPNVIKPDNVSAGVPYTGNLRWILHKVYDTVDTSGTPVANDFAKFSDADTIAGRSYTQTRSDLNVENGATADQTGAEIKTLYEAEANAYTDTKNTKLVGIATGADVTADNAPKAHKDSHDPQGGSDALDTTAPSELVGVQAAAEGSSHSFVRADHAHQIQHGIADNHLVTIDHNVPVSGDIARFTANGLEGRSKAEIQADMGLYGGTGTFAGTGGDTITIGVTLTGVAYRLTILPTGDALNVGTIYVTDKTTTTFIIKCTGSGTPTFDWTLLDLN